MKSLLALLLCVVIPSAMYAADTNDYTVVYRGGSLPNVKSGTKLRMSIGKDTVRLLQRRREIVNLAAKSIVEISYGRDVHRRVGTAIGLALVTPFAIGALAALSKSKKHYVGVTWAIGNEKGGLAMQCDKNEYRGVSGGARSRFWQTSSKARRSDRPVKTPPKPSLDGAPNCESSATRRPLLFSQLPAPDLLRDPPRAA